MQEFNSVSRYHYISGKLSELFKKIINKTPYNLGTYQFAKGPQTQYTGILQDNIEGDIVSPDEEFSFESYSSAIVSIVNSSREKFCVGIYGEWGTGKTTLMKLVERKLKPHIFFWEDVPGDDEEKLQAFLKQNFIGFNFTDNTKFEFVKTNDDKTLMISDNRSANSISIILDEKHSKAKIIHNDKHVYDLFITKKDNYQSEKGKMSIKENNVLSVWFNAWRYEREEQFALIPLLKTIAFGMGEHPFYKDLKPILLKGLEMLSKDIIRNLATRYIMTPEGIKDFEQKIVTKLGTLPEIDKDTIYFDGVKILEGEIKNIIDKYQKSRIIIFIDDLDRCSPETTLEVFESIKAFLDIDGFIFILGLSRETLDKFK